MTTETAATQPTPRAIDALLHKERRYPPEPEVVARAKWADPAIYERAAADPEGL